MRHLPVILVVLFLLAFGVRLAYWERSASFGAYELSYDDDEYYKAAVLFTDGEWFRDPYPLRYTRSPGYPLFLYPIFSAFGPDIEIALFFQVGVSVLTVALVYATARGAFGKRAGVFAAALMAIAPTYASLAGSFLLGETLFTFCILLFIYLLWRWTERGMSWWRALSLGVLLGYTALIRGQALYFLALAAVWFLYQAWRQNHLTFNLSALSVLLRAAAPLVLMLIGLAAVIAPWTWRNAVVYNRFVLLDTSNGWTVWRDHRTPNDDFWTTLPTIVNPADRAQYATARGIQNILHDPFNQIIVNGAANLVAIPHLELDSFAKGAGYLSDVIVDAPQVWQVLLNDIFFAAVFLLGLAGILLNARSLPGLLILWLVSFLVVVFLFHMQSRFRAHFLFVMIIFAGAALAAGGKEWREMELTRRAVWVGAAALFVVGMYSPRLAPVLASEYQLARAPSAGIAALKAAVDADPEYMKALDALGDGYRRAGDFENALKTYDRALEINPFEIQGRLGRIDIFRQQGNTKKYEREIALAGDDSGELEIPAPVWWAFDPAPTRLIELGDSASSLGYAMNFYAIQPDGNEKMRFSRERSFLKFPGVNEWDAQNVVIYARAVPRENQPLQQMTVRLNGTIAAQLQLTKNWQDYTVPLSDAVRAAPTLIVELDTPTFKPSLEFAGSTDTRELGAMVGYVELR